MLLFFMMPSPIAIILIIILAIIGFFSVRSYNNTKFDINRLSNLERYIELIISLVLIFLVTLMFFRNNKNFNALLGLVGINIILFILYTALIKAILLFSTKTDYSTVSFDGTGESKINTDIIQNRKKILIWIIVSTILVKFIGMSYIMGKVSALIKIIITFISVSFTLYLLYKTKDKSANKVLVVTKVIVLFILLVVSYKYDYESITTKNNTNNVYENNYVSELYAGGDSVKCTHGAHTSINQLLNCLDANNFISLDEDKIKIKDNIVNIKRGKSKIRIVQTSSSRESESYCAENYPKYRSFFIGNYAILEIENDKRDFEFDKMIKGYLNNYESMGGEVVW